MHLRHSALKKGKSVDSGSNKPEAKHECLSRILPAGFAPSTRCDSSRTLIWATEMLPRFLIVLSLCRQFKKTLMTSTAATPFRTKKSKSNWRHGLPNNLLSHITARSTQPCKILCNQTTLAKKFRP